MSDPLPASAGTTVDDESTGAHTEWQPWSGVVPLYIRWICFLWQFIKFTFIAYLCYRQQRILNERRPLPAFLVGKLSPETHELARNYHKSLNLLQMFSCMYWIIHEVWVILLAGFTNLWFLSGPIMNFLGFWPETWDQETGESIVFIFLLVGQINGATLPLDLWRTFVIEDTYGFNNLSLGTYMWEWLKLFTMEVLFSWVTGLLILWIVRETGRYFFIWLWVFSFNSLMISIAIYPNFIAPIFNPYTPLRNGRLKTRLKKLANFLGFPLEDIVILNQNWRSEHRGAYFYGLLGAKRIVLYDTLLEGYQQTEQDDFREGKPKKFRGSIPQDADYYRSTTSIPSRIIKTTQLNGITTKESQGGRYRHEDTLDMHSTGFTEYEIEAVVARLMGNWVLGHSVKDLILPVTSMFFFFFVFWGIYENSSLFNAFEFPVGINRPILLGLRLLYGDVMDITKIMVEVIMKHFDRQRFYEADAFAAKLGYGRDLIHAYIENDKENLNYPYFDSWYWNYHFSEPSLVDAIDAIELEMERMDWKKMD